ncbi:MAG: 3-hydroxybutyrate dehydrogenase [Pseudomonadota bacterium]
MNATDKGPGRVLTGRSAVVTGATSGIGLGIAGRLASAGADVLINGLGGAEDVQRALDSLSRAGPGRIVYSDANMLEAAEIEGMIEMAANEFGKLDILVNNAGIQHVSPVQSFPVEQWDAIIAVNLSACFHTIRAATPRLLANGWGRIVNIASTHALVASPFKSAYVAAKHGVAGLTKTVALELSQENVTVNAIAPGYVQTPLVDAQVADTAKAREISEDEVVRDVMLQAQPTGRFVQTGEVASLTLFLCGDEARSITGSVLPVDGGWSAH